MRLIILTIFAMLASACTRVETGEVGVRTTFSGKIVKQEEGQGFASSVLDTITVYSVKQIRVKLDNMQPKAGDNLTLDDLDLDIFYSVVPDKVADLNIKYSGTSVKHNGIYYPMYRYVKSVAKDVTYDVIAEYDSLEVHKSRDAIRLKIKNKLMLLLNKSDKDSFRVHNVVIRNVRTDASIEQAIKDNVAMDKKIATKEKEKQLVAEQIKINQQLQKTLTPPILKKMEIDMMTSAIDSGNTNIKFIYTIGNGVTPVMNVEK